MARSGRRPLCAALGVASLLLAVSACDDETFETAPAEILGHWTTEDEGYADRAFEITTEELHLLQGGDTISSHKIDLVSLSHDDWPFYSIEYTGEGDELFTFRFYLSQAKGGTLYFPNQRELLWHRTHQAEASNVAGSP